MKDNVCELAYEEFYRDSYDALLGALKGLLNDMANLNEEIESYGYEREVIENCKGRIKAPESISEKLIKLGYEATEENALTKVHDVVGIRAVCTYIDDVYFLVDKLREMYGDRIIKEKDYIKTPKRNGYRSFHMIVAVLVVIEDKEQILECEIQIRTSAMDNWATLEHQLKYKKNASNHELIVGELKKCADHIATSDINLTTIRQMIETTQV